MNVSLKTDSPNYLAAAFAVVYSFGLTELLDINRIGRTLIHRDYAFFEVFFLLLLWLLTVAITRPRVGSDQRSFFVFAGYGLLCGLVSGLIAPAAPLIVSAFAKQAGPSANHFLSWEDVVGLVWASTLVSFGWLLGVMSGSTLFLVLRKQKVWLVGILAFCVLLRLGRVAFQLTHGQRLW